MPFRKHASRKSSNEGSPERRSQHGKPSRVDLHLHTTYSDGSLTPAEVVALAAEAGLSAVAICDHDNIDGIDEALAAGEELGVAVLAGVELSVVWEEFRDVHLLGYQFDPHHEGLRQALAEFREVRERRNEEVVRRVNEKLSQEGRAPLDFERVREFAGGTVGRPHVARALAEKGYVKSTEEAFRNYLVPCNAPKRYFPIADAIDLVHAAGGVAVLAHPPFITQARKGLEVLFDTFADFGLDGIEAWNSGANNDDIDWTITQARRRGLIVTGGSDFHGTPKGDIRIGTGHGNLRIPYSCVEEIRRAVQERQAAHGRVD